MGEMKTSAGWPRMYAVVRKDLGKVPTGKLMGSAGHAFVGAFYDSFDPALSRETMARAYAESPEHAKIVLGIDNEAFLRALRIDCEAGVVPHHLVTDFAHTVFDQPTVTALGIGPITETEYRALGLDKLEIFR